jgi:hypothetical protein
MKVIDVRSRKGPEQLTCMVTGHSRAGKTHFASTWPRPIFLCDASEHGYTTLAHVPEKMLYEEGRPPYAIAIENVQDMAQCVIALQQQAQGLKPTLKGWPVPQGQWEIGTVVIDSLTFYADAYFSALEAQTAGQKVDKRQLYGELGSHLRYFMIEFHKLPYHVVWTALASLNEDSQLRGAMVSGRTAATAPARCDLWCYADKVEERAAKGDREAIYRYDMHTQNYLGNKAGHRFGDQLPPVIDPEYGVIEESLGMSPWTDRVQAKKKKTAPKGRKADNNQRATAPTSS